MNQDAGELVKVLETRDQALIATAKSFLDGADIQYAMNNEFSEGVWPTSPDNGAQIWVRPEDAEVARTILSGLMEETPLDADSSEAPEMEEVAEEQPVTMDELSYSAPRPEQPFSIRLLIVVAIFLIPIILAIIYSLQKQPAR